MRTFLTLLIREVKSLFYSPIAYVVLVYFYILMGFNTWMLLNAINGLPLETTLIQQFFTAGAFWFPFILVFPLITMRTFSEEFRMGTIETLTTAPVTDLQIVLSKQLSTFFFSCLLLAPSLLFFATWSFLSNHSAATASGAYVTSYGLLLLMSFFFCSIGCLASALTKDQVNAAMISFTTITLLLFLGFIFDIMNITSPLAHEMQRFLSPYEHMIDFSKGVVDSRPIVFYVTMSAFVTFLTFQVFQYRKWKA